MAAPVNTNEIEAALQRKAGPLKMWQWGVAAFGGIYWWRHRAGAGTTSPATSLLPSSTSGTGSSPLDSGGGGGGSSDTTPQPQPDNPAAASTADNGTAVTWDPQQLADAVSAGITAGLTGAFPTGDTIPPMTSTPSTPTAGGTGKSSPHRAIPKAKPKPKAKAKPAATHKTKPAVHKVAPRPVSTRTVPGGNNRKTSKQPAVKAVVKPRGKAASSRAFIAAVAKKPAAAFASNPVVSALKPHATAAKKKPPVSIMLQPHSVLTPARQQQFSHAVGASAIGAPAATKAASQAHTSPARVVAMPPPTPARTPVSRTTVPASRSLAVESKPAPPAKPPTTRMRAS